MSSQLTINPFITGHPASSGRRRNTVRSRTPVDVQRCSFERSQTTVYQRSGHGEVVQFQRGYVSDVEMRRMARRSRIHERVSCREVLPGLQNRYVFSDDPIAQLVNSYASHFRHHLRGYLQHSTEYHCQAAGARVLAARARARASVISLSKVFMSVLNSAC